MKYFNKLTPLALALGFAAGAAQAVTINSGLVGGEQNRLQDESRESYVDANNDGKFGVGDVIFGYIKIDKFNPSGLDANNQVYGVFSQQVANNSSGINLFFEATTVAGLRLTDLLGGNPNVGSNALAAFYDRSTPYTADLTISKPAGSPTSMKDYIDYIRNNGTLRLAAGFVDADDFLYSLINPLSGITVGSSTSMILSAPSGSTVAFNTGALSLTYNATGLEFEEQDAGGGADGQVLVAEGTTGSATGTSQLPAPTNTWKNAGPGFSQCKSPTTGADTDCGFTDKNNFFVTPIPEPGSLSLFSAALLGLAGFARRRKS